MPAPNGLDVLRLARARDPDMPVILITAAPSTQTAIDAVNLRATAYLTKPIESERLDAEVQSALSLTRLSSVRKEAHALLNEGRNMAPCASSPEFDSALDGLFMAFQPIVSWEGRRAYGYEALVRSSAPAAPHPGALFAAADRAGRSQELSRLIWQKTAEVRLPDGVDLFLNLDAGDLLDETLFDAATPLSAIASRVVLELTERAQLEGVPEAAERVAALRRLGFRIAVDDIGAGYSGLSSFALLKPDVVKLDISLVRGIDADRVKRRLAGLVIELCRDLGILVVGEGVESARERDALAELRCDLQQGFLFGRPSLPFSVPVFDSLGPGRL